MAVSPISSVSDTARWVAVYRAWESARPDALFRDPYADMLAGARGREIAALMPRQARSGWPLVARTQLIDELVRRALAEGCDCVLNLAAGLDTRPYRLELPAALHWVEADLPAILEEKERQLRAAQPRCELTRLKVDLADARARAAALADVTGRYRRILVITEGLLLYLDDSQVSDLATSLARYDGIRWWVLDLASPDLLRLLRRTMGAHLANAPMKFAPANGVAYFEALGWRVAEVHSILRAAARFGRLPWFLRLLTLLPEPDPRQLGRARWNGVVRLERPRQASERGRRSAL
ncbi:MAG TPA: SAM-dependent methyltransferase [Steroidobacteraceae bacterium]|nr:SAM-dependent methyltransferase [Steroidobacteraceae bacterium]